MASQIASSIASILDLRLQTSDFEDALSAGLRGREGFDGAVKASRHYLRSSMTSSGWKRDTAAAAKSGFFRSNSPNFFNFSASA